MRSLVLFAASSRRVAPPAALAGCSKKAEPSSSGPAYRVSCPMRRRELVGSTPATRCDRAHVLPVGQRRARCGCPPEGGPCGSSRCRGLPKQAPEFDIASCPADPSADGNRLVRPSRSQAAATISPARIRAVDVTATQAAVVLENEDTADRRWSTVDAVQVVRAGARSARSRRAFGSTLCGQGRLRHH